MPSTGISISVWLIQSPLSKIAWFSRVSLRLTSLSQDNFLVQRDVYGTSWWWEKGVQGLCGGLAFFHTHGWNRDGPQDPLGSLVMVRVGRSAAEVCGSHTWLVVQILPLWPLVPRTPNHTRTGRVPGSHFLDPLPQPFQMTSWMAPYYTGTILNRWYAKGV